MALEYSDIVMDHYRNPRNVGVIENPSGIGEVGNPQCGDLMNIYLKIGENSDGKEYIEDIKFQTFGCGAAIANSSIMTETVMGKTLDELFSIGETDKNREKTLKKQLVESLGGLPLIKEHCSALASEGLFLALNDYLKNKKPNKK